MGMAPGGRGFSHRGDQPARPPPIPAKSPGSAGAGRVCLRIDRRRRGGWDPGVLGGAVLVGLLAAWVLVLPGRLAPPLPADLLDRLGDRDRLEVGDARLKLHNDLRTTALQAIAGLAVLAGAVLAFQQLTADRQQATATRELTLQGQASERFTRAIDQLGNDREEVRLGGIYGLEQIAQQAPDNRLAVIEVLVAYLHRSRQRAKPTQPLEPSTRPVEQLRDRALDVQAALTVIVRRSGELLDPSLNLSDLDLRGADISQQVLVVNRQFGGRPAHLGGADLRGSDLRGATFKGVILSGADLRGADLRGADLRKVEPTRGGATNVTATSGIENANLRGALADNSTQWPYEFDWRAAGVTMT
jgi:hypothetical protein